MSHYETKNQEFVNADVERRLLGLQRNFTIHVAQSRETEKKHERRIRDLEIRMAVEQGVPQRRVAQIYEMTPGRISQIVRKAA